MLRKKGLLLLGVCVVLAVCAGTQAAPITLVNGDFENSGATPDDGYGTDMVLDGWSFLGGGTATGVHNPSASQIAAEAHSGEYCAFVNGTSWGCAGPVQQTLTGVTYQPNTTYTLSAYVAYRNDHSSYPVDAELQLWDVDNATHFSVASTQYDITSEGAWELATVSFTTGTSDACLGDQITIRFNVIAGSGQLLIDDITLDAVPEPASMCLMGLGGLGLWLRRKRVSQ